MPRPTAPFHTPSQSVPLTLPRMWNAGHFVLVKLVPYNVFPSPSQLQEAWLLCPGSSTGCGYTWLPSRTKVPGSRPSAGYALFAPQMLTREGTVGGYLCRRLTGGVHVCVWCVCVCVCSMCVVCVWCVYRVL